MAWTYDSDNLDNDLFRVRLLSGDNDSTDELLQDEEVEFFIETEANIYMAAAQCCFAIASKFARKVDKEMGDLKLNASQRQRQFQSLGERWATRGGTSGVPTAGGISISEKEALESDTDKVSPFFKRELFDNT